MSALLKKFLCALAYSAEAASVLRSGSIATAKDESAAKAGCVSAVKGKGFTFR